jgi:hypothetical protein
MSLPINARLTFRVTNVGGASSVDEYGNVVPAIDLVTVYASLGVAGQSYRGTEGPIFVSNGTQLVGRSVSPKLLPEGLPSQASIVYTDPATGQETSGTIQLDLSLASKFRAVTLALGSKISGTFTVEGAS